MPKRVSNYKVPIVFVHQPGDAYQPQGVDMKRRFVLAPQRGAAYQPRVQPRGKDPRIIIFRPSLSYSSICGVPSERRNLGCGLPRVSPWAGMRCPFGAIRTTHLPPIPPPAMGEDCGRWIVSAPQRGDSGQSRCPRDKNTIRFRAPTG